MHTSFAALVCHVADIYRCSHGTSKQYTPLIILEMLILLFLVPRMIGWYVYETFHYPDRLTMSRAAFVFAVQTWLAQTPEQAKKAGTPGYLSAAMACEPSMPNLCSSATNVSCGLVLGLGTVNRYLEAKGHSQFMLINPRRIYQCSCRHQRQDRRQAQRPLQLLHHLESGRDS